MFTDEACFHVPGKVNQYNVRIWGSENPHIVIEHIRNISKVNVWCGLLHDCLVGPFIFAEETVTSTIDMTMLEGVTFPQIEDLQPHIIFQQDGAPPHWALVVRAVLNEYLPGRWIGRDGPNTCSSWLPDITPLDFFLWGFVKDVVCNTKMANLQDACGRHLWGLLYNCVSVAVCRVVGLYFSIALSFVCCTWLLYTCAIKLACLMFPLHSVSFLFIETPSCFT